MSEHSEDYDHEGEAEDKGSSSEEDGREDDQPVSSACSSHKLDVKKAMTSGKLGICWFPEPISQFKLGSPDKRSNACTIIALLVAEKIHKQGIQIRITKPTNDRQPINKASVNAFAQSILEGNQIHDGLRLGNKLRHYNLTVPEAIDAAADKMLNITEWCSLVSERDISKFLYEDLKEKTDEWYKKTPQQCGSDLYVVLIADCRSVLFAFQNELDKVTLIDSHQHYEDSGAVMAQVSTEDLWLLCEWYNYLLDGYDSTITEYELTYLYFRRSAKA